MLSKCANPSCSTPLVYLREGKIFMLESAPEVQKQDQGVAKPKPVQRVEHFWLCGPCSASLTIYYDRVKGIRVIRKPQERSFRAAAAS